MELSDFSIRATNNIYCAAIVLSGGDHTVVNNVWWGGPEMFTTPSYINAFITHDQVATPPKMVGMIVGGNQPLITHCRAFATADGIVYMGDSLSHLVDFNAIVCDNVTVGSSAYPLTSELSLNAGILVPRNSQIELLGVDNALMFDTCIPVYIGSSPRYPQN